MVVVWFALFDSDARNAFCSAVLAITLPMAVHAVVGNVLEPVKHARNCPQYIQRTP